MPDTITNAIATAAAGPVAEKIKAAADSAAVVNNYTAQNLAKEAVAEAVQSPAVKAAIKEVLPDPIPWYESTSLWGNIIAGIGALVAAAPQITPIIETVAQPEHVQWWNAAITLLGAFLGIVGAVTGGKGRITTTRPIAGTEAAAKVERAAQ